MLQRNQGYWSSLFFTIRSVYKGLALTARHMVGATKRSTAATRLDISNHQYFNNQEGITTASFPHETLPIPENGRYKLHNEMDDCIVCDKCVKVCPVSCIAIEPIRSPEEFGKTSDGTSKRIYAASFDIDMSKCCFCGLCTTVCPTECLTMTPEYAFSTDHLPDHNISFANLSEQEIILRKNEWEVYLKQKASQDQTSAAGTTASASPPKPVIKPLRPKFGS